MPTERNDTHRNHDGGLTGNSALRQPQLKYIRTVVLLSLLFSPITLLSAETPESIASGNDDQHGDPLVEDQLTSEASRAYLRLLFEKYGDPSTTLNGGSSIDDHSSTDMTMTFEGFEHLLENLGLGDVHITDHITDDHRQSSNSAIKSDSGLFRRLHEHDEMGWHRHKQRRTEDHEIDREKRSVGDDNRSPHATDDKPQAKTVVTLSEINVISSSRPRREHRADNEKQSSLVMSEGAIVLQKVYLIYIETYCNSESNLTHVYRDPIPDVFCYTGYGITKINRY